ncbi:hypothetical protein MRB53_041750 [Persea americana]|nr:hypothetical protein MRB53_041750 [Persea americana]
MTWTLFVAFVCSVAIGSVSARILDTNARCNDYFGARLQGAEVAAVSTQLKVHRDLNSFSFTCIAVHSDMSVAAGRLLVPRDRRISALHCPSDMWAVADETNADLGKCVAPPAGQPKIEITSREVCDDKFRSTLPSLTYNLEWPYFFSEDFQLNERANGFTMHCIVAGINLNTNNWETYPLSTGPTKSFHYTCPAGTVAQEFDSWWNGFCRDPKLPEKITKTYLRTGADSPSSPDYPCREFIYHLDKPGTVQLFTVPTEEYGGRRTHSKAGGAAVMKRAKLHSYRKDVQVGFLEGDHVFMLQLPAVKGMKFVGCADTGDIPSEIHMRPMFV